MFSDDWFESGSFGAGRNEAVATKGLRSSWTFCGLFIYSELGSFALVNNCSLFSHKFFTIAADQTQGSDLR